MQFGNSIETSEALDPISAWLRSARIGIIGLGYVGLPLAVEFGKSFPVIGFDISKRRIESLRKCLDSTLETSREELQSARYLTYTTYSVDLKDCNVMIIAVPTPIDKLKRPDLTDLLAACRVAGSVLKRGDLVIFESTVYPGCTEEDCVPVLEATSGLKLNEDFHVGYSPERVNPGDKEHRLTDVVKVTSGSNSDALARVDALYGAIVKAGTFPTESIKVAEAAKVIENTQRDLNIALVNELAIIFNRLGIDTKSVLEAAGTKWNFLDFRPGLVGGHCIGVDPYYLTHKAESIGYRPEIILAGRRLNDGMGRYCASQLIQAMSRKGIPIKDARVLLLGFAFKENCPDTRNTLVTDLYWALKEYGCQVDVHDPVVSAEDVLAHTGIVLLEKPGEGTYDATVLAVGHDAFRNLGAAQIRKFGRSKQVFFDLKHLFDRSESDLRL
jgi:UDP-N-acetyl-D-galactosamine dehydrogenase